jgi:rRNA maturation protein Nop10
MPTNAYVCETCSNHYTFIGAYKNRKCPECGKENEPTIPSEIPSPSTFELVDSYRGVKWREGQKDRYEQRAANHLKHEAKERARSSGTQNIEHGITEDDGKLV